MIKQSPQPTLIIKRSHPGSLGDTVTVGGESVAYDASDSPDDWIEKVCCLATRHGVSVSVVDDRMSGILPYIRKLSLFDAASRLCWALGRRGAYIDGYAEDALGLPSLVPGDDEHENIRFDPGYLVLGAAGCKGANVPSIGGARGRGISADGVAVPVVPPLDSTCTVVSRRHLPERLCGALRLCGVFVSFPVDAPVGDVVRSAPYLDPVADAGIFADGCGIVLCPTRRIACRVFAETFGDDHPPDPPDGPRRVRVYARTYSARGVLQTENT